MTKKRFLMFAAIAIIAMILTLHFEGRSFISKSGKVLLWVTDINSAENSQQLADPYSFTHVLHGVMFCLILGFISSRLKNKLSFYGMFLAAVCAEGIWEIIENSPWVIDRYREATIALGYTGDTILNSISDVCMCSMGFLLSSKLGVKKSIMFFIAVEIFLILWIKDSLVINIIMLISPIDALKNWQAH